MFLSNCGGVCPLGSDVHRYSFQCDIREPTLILHGPLFSCVSVPPLLFWQRLLSDCTARMLPLKCRCSGSCSLFVAGGLLASFG